MIALSCCAPCGPTAAPQIDPLAQLGSENIQPEPNALVNIEPFGEYRTWDSGRDIGMQWKDAHRVSKTVVKFRDGQQLPDPSTVKLQYWQGEWRNADVQVAVEYSNGIWPSSQMPRGHWAYEAIGRLITDGFITGVSADFSGKTPRTREEFARTISAAGPVLKTRLGQPRDVNAFSKLDFSAIMLLAKEFNNELPGAEPEALQWDAICLIDRVLPVTNELHTMMFKEADGTWTRAKRSPQYSTADFGAGEGDDKDKCAAWTLTLKPTGAADNRAGFCTTAQLRLLFPSDLPAIQYLQVYTDSTWRKTSVALEWARVSQEDRDCRFDALNGVVKVTKFTSAGVTTSWRRNTTWVSVKTSGDILMDLWYAEPAEAGHTDETIVDVRYGAHSFSFAARDIVNGKRTLVPECGVLIKPGNDATTYAQEAGGKRTK